MVEKIQKTLRDSAFARWAVLVLVASMMFFAYMFVDILSPLASLLEQSLNWDRGDFGTYAAGEYLLNVFGFLIIAGLILDKSGIRFTGTLSASLMFIGAVIKFIAVNDWFQTTALADWLNSWWVEMPASAKMAAFGFMIFGCGCEMAGTTVSKAIAKWFKGKEMALAMGLEMAIARIGVFAIFSISPMIAESMGTVVAPVAFCTVLLLIGLITFIVFTFMDKKLDKQMGANAEEGEAEEEFKFSDIGKIFSSKIFWVVALLCVLYYSAIFPFQRYGANMLQCNLGISASTASSIFRWFPIGAAIITPFLGNFLDKKGKGATMLMWGSLLLICCHLIFAFVVPATSSPLIAYATIVILGISFALVPAALWPSVPKIIEEKVLGSAYCLIFWVQNIGLCFVPVLIGNLLASSNAENELVQQTKTFVESYQNTLSAIDRNDSKTFDIAYTGAIEEFATLEKKHEELSQENKTPAVEMTYKAALEASETLKKNHDDIVAYMNEHPTAPKTSSGFWDFLSKDSKETTLLTERQDELSKAGSGIFVPYRFTVPLLLFAGFGILAFLFAIYLKALDRKKGYGLELPNIQK